MKAPIPKTGPSAKRSIAVVALACALAAAFVLHLAAASVTNLGIKKIEITQAVQCLDTGKGYTNCPDNALELDTQRATAIRVYIQHNGSCSYDYAPFEVVVPAATVKISWAVSHDPTGHLGGGELLYTMEKKFDVPCTNDLSKLRDDEKGSATFIIPASKLASVDKKEFIWVEAQVVPPVGLVDTNAADDTLSTQAGGKDDQGKVIPGGFVPRKVPLTVSWALVHYKPLPSTQFEPYAGGPLGCDPAASKLLDCPVFDYVWPTMKQLYPGKIQYDPSPTYLIYAGVNPQTNQMTGLPDIRDDNSGALLGLLESMRKIPKLWFGGQAPRVLMGWLPNGAHKGANYIGMGGIVAESEVYDNGPETLAHESGHVLSISHPDEQGTCWPFDTPGDGFDQGDIREAGFRMWTGLPIRADSSDFMVKGTPYVSSGISPFHWGVLGAQAGGTWIGGDVKYSAYWSKIGASCYGTLGSQSAVPLLPLPDDLPSAPSAASQPALLVRGYELSDGTAVISPFYVYASAGPFLDSDPGGRYCLELSGSGTPVATTCFNPEYARPEPAGEQVGTFVFQVPFPAGVDTAAVRQGTTELVRRTAGAIPPEAKITSPTAGAQFDLEMQVAWTSNTSGGQAPFSMVLYSVDAGMTYHPLAFDLHGTDITLPIDARLLAGSDTAMVRIVTTDGLNTVTADSAAFKVANKAPLVSIDAPFAGARINGRKEIVLAGHATDLEDGALGDDALVWTEAGAIVGTGPEVVLESGTMTPGTHTIVLTATDRSGVATSVSVTFTIYEQRYIDIKPFSWPNAIQLKNEGVIPVAILSSDSFSAFKEVDRLSLTFGKAGAEASLVRCSDRPQDANRDGIPDLLCTFDTRLTGFDCGTSEGILLGRTNAGTPIGGRDFVRIGCGK